MGSADREVNDFELKRKLLEQRNITLEEALDKARAWEAAGRQASNMTTSPPLANGNSSNVVNEHQRMRNDEKKSVTIVEERGKCIRCCHGERDSDVVRGRTNKQQKNSGHQVT